MKKRYIKPECEIFMVAVSQQLLAGSDPAELNGSFDNTEEIDDFVD